MKKLLIIQQDEAYFLFETLQVIEKYPLAFKDFELTLLVNENSYKAVFNKTVPVVKGLTTDRSLALNQKFDISVNLSLAESSWALHGLVQSGKKVGTYLKDNQLVVEDLWSSFLLTLKSRTPFLTFHLQDIYKHILGIKAFQLLKNQPTAIRQIAYGMTNTNLFPAQEQEKLIELLATNFPSFSIKDISEVDLVSDVSQTLYLGPGNLEALKFCEAGGKGIFLSEHFRGFNFLPYGAKHLLVSSRSRKFSAEKLFNLIFQELSGEALESEYSLYRCDPSHPFGMLLESLNESDDNYPFYQSHVVLWNFLLNLYDTDLSITKCTSSQLSLLKSNQEILSKLIRFHDYAMSSIDSIFHESKESTVDEEKIRSHASKLNEIEVVSDQIADAQPFLRPVIDFYRIRRGQNFGSTLSELSQTSFLTYVEEHQALQALNELFSVTLRKNEANI